MSENNEKSSLYLMAEAAAKVLAIAELELTYGEGSVDIEKVRAKPLRILECMAYLSIFVTAGCTIPDKPKPITELIKERKESGKARSTEGNT